MPTTYQVAADGVVKVSGSASITGKLALSADGVVIVSGDGSITAPTPQVQNVIASPGDTSALVGWRVPITANPILSYTITPYIGVTAQAPTTISGSPPANFTTITGLTNGVAYTFTVYATTIDGDGPPSAHSNLVTPRAPEPSELELGFEIEVWSPDTNTKLAVLEGATDVTFQIQLNQAGSGSFRINKHDHKIDPTYTFPNGMVGDPTLLSIGNLIRVKLNGTYVFAFFIEEPANVEDSPSGPSDEVYQPQGRGAMAYLERATVHPEGWTPGQSSSTSAALDHTYNGSPAAAILFQQIMLAKGRGAIPDVHFDWNYTIDSSGAVWTDSQTLRVHVGNDLLVLLQKMAPFGVDFFMNYNPPLTLQAFKAPHEVDRTANVVLRQGRHLGGSEKSTVNKHFSGLRTRFLVEGSGGVAVEQHDAAEEAIAGIGIREGYLSWGSTADIPTLNGVATAAINDSENQSEPIHVAVIHDREEGGYEPFQDYNLGDLVKLDIPNVYSLAVKRIIGMTFSRPQTSGSSLDYKLFLDLGSISLDPLLRLMASQQLGIPLVGSAIGTPGPPGAGGGTGAGGGGSGIVGLPPGGNVGDILKRIPNGAEWNAELQEYLQIDDGGVLQVGAITSSSFDAHSTIASTAGSVGPGVWYMRFKAHISVLCSGFPTEVPQFTIDFTDGQSSRNSGPTRPPSAYQYISVDGSYRTGTVEAVIIEALPEGSYVGHLRVSRVSDQVPWTDADGPLTIFYQFFASVGRAG